MGEGLMGMGGMMFGGWNGIGGLGGWVLFGL